MQHMWTTLILLQLLLAAAATADTTATVRGCRPSCGGVDIPYPFGIGGGCFRKGFEIECVNNGPVLAGTSLRVVNLTLDPDESQVMLPMGWQCYNASDPDDTYSNWDYGETKMNKDGVYRISNSRNMLVVVGCNTFGFTASKRTEGGSANYAYSYYTGCMSYCSNSDSARDGVCDGVGCCRVNIPPGLTDNYFNFREQDHSGMMDYRPCDYAFLADRNYTFSRSDLKMNTKRTSPVWLDWAIRGNNSISGDIPSCKQAAKTDQYACVSAHSDCVNSTNGPGYNCKCSKGYEGDAYLPNGCTNIDECAHPTKYPCHGICTDTQGWYGCDCPAGSRSHDPRPENRTMYSTVPTRSTDCRAISGILVLAFLSFIFILRKERRQARDFYRKNGGLTLQNARSIKIFRKEELKPILKTNNLIGKGGFGEVYKGDLDGVPVAIKKPIGDNVLVNNQLPNEVIIQSQVFHRNIVSLMGCCLEVDTPMLVYEFVSNGSLDDILHKDKNKFLRLDVRLRILQESANGLAYMHSQTNEKILHGDVKPANILLDDNFTPKISDFGISRLIAKDKEHTMNIIGDMTYMDPVYVQTGRLTDRSDVYSFGVVILELISGKKATHSDNNSLVNSFLDCHRERKKATELFDKKIATGNLEILDKLKEIAVQCLSLEVDQRPSMTGVAQSLLLLHGSCTR